VKETKMFNLPFVTSSLKSRGFKGFRSALNHGEACYCHYLLDGRSSLNTLVNPINGIFHDKQEMSFSC